MNAHEIPLTEPSSVAVYNNASLIEHSCRPNLSKSFTAKNEIVFWAPHPIKKGERLSICYSDVLWGTVNRMEHLLQTKLFRCACVRCVDPTEFGTFFSAMKCSGFKKDANCNGLLLPENVKNWRGDWICNKCRGSVEAKLISNIESRASVDQQAMQKDNEQHCNLYISHYSRWLAPNHHYIVCVKLSLSQIIGGGHPEAIKTISDDNLMNKIKICQELINLFEKICPGIWMYTIVLLISSQYYFVFQLKHVSLEPPDSSCMPPWLSLDDVELCLKIRLSGVLSKIPYSMPKIAYGCYSMSQKGYQRTKSASRPGLMWVR